MALFTFGESERKHDPKYWTPRIVDARQDLWKGNIDKASVSFTKILHELGAVKTRGLQDEILITKAEVHLGLWAVKYLKNKQDCSGYRKILDGAHSTPNLWLFVAKVLSINKDISPDA